MQHTLFLLPTPESQVMSSVNVNILARTEFDEILPTGAVRKMIRITYQLQDGRIGSVTIQAGAPNTDIENKAIAESIKALPKSAFETKEIKLG